MNQSFVISLLGNSVLLIALVAVYDLLHDRLKGVSGRWLAGLFIGAAGVILIGTSATLQEGIIFDTRSVLLSTTALFLGPVAAVVAGLMCALFRFSLGGPGIYPGLVVITLSVLTGLVWRWARGAGRGEPGWAELYLFGVLVHVLMLASMLVLPLAAALDVLRAIALPVMGAFPVATVLLGGLMVRRIRHQQSLESLRESEERYRTLFTSNRVPTLIIDPRDGLIVDANPAAQRFYGWTGAELRARRIQEINTLDAGQVESEMTRALTGEQNFFRFRHRVADGRVKEVEVFSGPMELGGRKLLCSIVHDVTDRMEAERRITELSKAVEQAPAAIVITGADGAIQYVNPEFTAVTGYSREEVIGKTPAILKSGEMDERVYRELWETIKSGKVWRGDLLNRARDGRLFWERAVISPIVDADGQARQFVAVKEDITAEREREEMLRQALRRSERLAHEALAADRAKSAFLANMSHEIRTPLNGIMGMLEILAETHLTEEQLGLIGTARESSHSLLNLLSNVLDYSRLEASRLDVLKVPYNPREILDKLARRFSAEARARRLDFDFRVSGELPALMQGDPMRIKQVLGNLLSNAVKFTDAGLVTLEAGLRAGGPGPDQLRIEVADTGIGIPPDKQGDLFHPFYQVQTGHTRNYMGSGLGLSIAKHLVHLMGGRIGFSSQPGSGSRFWIELPVRIPEVPAGAPPALPQADPAAVAPGRREAVFPAMPVLLVEDNVVNRKVAVTFLKRLGLDVDCATNGVEAIAACGNRPYKLVLMDVQMPVMDGLEATRNIRTHLVPQVRQIPVVALTAMAGIEDREAFVAAGMNGCLIKPVSLDSLAEEIARHIEPLEAAGS